MYFVVIKPLYAGKKYEVGLANSCAMRAKLIMPAFWAAETKEMGRAVDRRPPHKGGRT
jgi:hypothetical protein